MLKSIFLLVLFSIFACNNSTVKDPEVDLGEVVVSTHEPSIPVGPEYPVKDVQKVFTVRVTATNYTEVEIVRLKKASEIIEKIVNSEEYRKETLGHQYSGKLTFVDNMGLSNEAVYQKLFAGAEALIPAVNYQMDLTVTGYRKSNSTIGYTTANQMIVYTNRKFHDKYGPCDVAGNLFHEWTHKMGFDHASRYSTSRDYSVPYSQGYLIEKLCAKYL